MMNPGKMVLIITSFVVGLVETVLGFRILLKLFGARTSAPFVEWVYATSKPLLAPFEGMFPAPELTGGLVIEFSALFALIIYSSVGYALNGLVRNFEVEMNKATKKK